MTQAATVTKVDSEWKPLEPSLDALFAEEVAPLEALAEGRVPAVILRKVMTSEQVAELIGHLEVTGHLHRSEDERINRDAYDPTRVDRWTGHAINNVATSRRRVDIGASLGFLGDDPETFFAKSAEAHELFQKLFAQHLNPIQVVYHWLQKLVRGKVVVNAHEPDGRAYGPAIFRIHYGGYTYPPHFDSVKNRECRTNYAVYKYSTQLAGVLCLQNAVREGQTAQCIMHRCFWNPERNEPLRTGKFHDYAAEHQIQSRRIDLEPGDLYFFNTGLIHEVPGVDGDLPRVVLATFIGYSKDDPEIMVWS